MTVTLLFKNGKSMSFSGGKEDEPAVFDLEVHDENGTLTSGINVVDFGHRVRGYVCERSLPSEAVTAPKAKPARFRHQHTGIEFDIQSGD